jgi:broad specificity phosphatase PhoE
MERDDVFWEPVLVIFLLASCATGGSEQKEAAARSSDETASQLCVVRHAQAYGNLKGAPSGLTTEQRNTLTEKGRVQAKRLGAEVPRPVAAVFASPTGRARMTAELMGLSVPIGLTGELRALEDESLSEGRQRILEALDRARAEVTKGKHVVMVTHGKVAALLIGELKGTPLSKRPSAHRISFGEAVCLPMQESNTD